MTIPVESLIFTSPATQKVDKKPTASGNLDVFRVIMSDQNFWQGDGGQPPSVSNSDVTTLPDPALNRTGAWHLSNQLNHLIGKET